MTFKQFKELNRGNDLKKALGGFGRALNTAWQRFMIENPDMDPRTARAMRDLHQSVGWLYSNIGKKNLDDQEKVRFDMCMRTLQNAGHILNDPAGGKTARDYLVQPGEDTEELTGHLSTLNKKFGIDFSNEAQPYTDPKGYRYYKDMMDENGERWIEKQNHYIHLSRLISNASKKIEFSDADEEKEFNEVLAAMIVLGINKQVRKRIKDKNDNEALVDVKDEAQALEILNGKKLDAFLSKKFGNSQKTVMELMREELKMAVREDPEEAEKNYGSLVEDLNRGVRTVLEYHADPDAGYNETKSGAEWIEEIKKTDEIYGFDPRNALVGEGVEGEGYAYNVNMMSHILAARDLSNAKAGSRKELDNRMISSRELDKKAEEMMQEYELMDCAFNCMKNSELQDLMKGKNHCGDLDAAISDELLKLEPGMLPNRPAYRHFMPTVKDRIEFLQKQAERGDSETKIRAAAEILVLRNIAHAHRGKKSSLNKQIPTSSTNSLRHGVSMLASDPSFRNLVLKTPASGLISEGHGGEMIDKMREYANTLNQDPDQKKHLSGFVGSMLKGNTLGGRMELIRREAEGLQKQLQMELDADLGKQNQQHIDELKEQTEKLLMEYTLCNQESHKIVKGKQVGPDANIPWIDFEKTLTSRTRDPRYQGLSAAFNPERTNNILKHMASESPEQFFGGSLQDKAENDPDLADDLLIPDNQSEGPEEDNNKSLDDSVMSM